MNTIIRFGIVFSMLALFISYVNASLPTRSGESDCKANEFWYSEKSCCLPQGGASSAPSPPSDKSCPPAGWYWSRKYSCCVPSQPSVPSSPPPQCSKGWEWLASTYACRKQTTATLTSRPSPSASGRHQKRLHGGLARTRKRAAPLCPSGLDACPIAGISGLTGDYECLDTFNELESCGGCSSLGKGQDCTTIEGSWNVGCHQGMCAVYTCTAGYKRSLDGKSCIAL